MSKQSKEQRAARAAALLEERRRKERRRQVLSVVGVLAALVLIVGGGFLINNLRDDSDETAAAAPAAGSDSGLTIGDASAPHKVVVYEDFLCPFCGELEAATHSDLEQLADEGKVQVEYRPLNFLARFGDYSGDAAQAFAVTLDTDRADTALALHDALFSDQPSEEGPFPSVDDLATTMSDAGASDEAVQAFRDGDGEEWVDRVTQEANDLGISSTPTVILDGKPFTDGRTIDELAQNLLSAVG